MVGVSWRHRSRWDKRKKLHKGKNFSPPRLPIGEHHVQSLVLLEHLLGDLKEGIAIEVFDNAVQKIRLDGDIVRYEMRHEGLISEFMGDGPYKVMNLSPKAKAILVQYHKIRLNRIGEV